jgi:hypothetical protein
VKNIFFNYYIKKTNMPRHSKRYESSSSSESEYEERRNRKYQSESESSSDSDASQSDLEELECKFDRKFVWRLRREPNLMVNGCESHINIYSQSLHTIAVGDAFPFDGFQDAHNMVWDTTTSEIVIQFNGLYYFSYAFTTDQPCQVAIFVNGVADPTTVAGNNSGATVTAGSQVLRLFIGDRVKLVNWKSNGPINLTYVAAGDINIPTTNADFTMFRIAPLVSQWGPAPLPFEKPTFCDNVPKYNDNDKDGNYVMSKCEVKEYKLEKKLEEKLEKCKKEEQCKPTPPPKKDDSSCESSPRRKKHRKHHRRNCH